MTIRLALTLIAGMAGWLLTTQAQATPIGYEFYQGGYAGGAYVSGFFLGEDLDGNGQLAAHRGEVSGFRMLFSGFDGEMAWSLGQTDLLGLVYDLNGGPLGDGFRGRGEGMLAWGETGFGAGVGPLGLICALQLACGVVAQSGELLLSHELVHVQQSGHYVAVAEPGPLGLILMGAVALVLARRRLGH